MSRRPSTRQGRRNFFAFHQFCKPSASSESSHNLWWTHTGPTRGPLCSHLHHSCTCLVQSLDHDEDLLLLFLQLLLATNKLGPLYSHCWTCKDEEPHICALRCKPLSHHMRINIVLDEHIFSVPSLLCKLSCFCLWPHSRPLLNIRPFLRSRHFQVDKISTLWCHDSHKLCC